MTFVSLTDRISQSVLAVPTGLLDSLRLVAPVRKSIFPNSHGRFGGSDISSPFTCHISHVAAFPDAGDNFLNVWY